MAHQALLKWTAPVGGEAVVSYDIQRADAPGGVVGTYKSIANVPATVTTYADASVVGGSQYAYEVMSVNGAGESSPCPAVIVTIPLAKPQPPTALTVEAS